MFEKLLSKFECVFVYGYHIWKEPHKLQYPSFSGDYDICVTTYECSYCGKISTKTEKLTTLHGGLVLIENLT